MTISEYEGFGPFNKRPNFIIFMTDQQRRIQHFPKKWVEENLPNLSRIKKHGMTFKNAICSTCACSPSRATLFTGTYPAIHSIKAIGGLNDPTSKLPNTPTSLGKILKTAGYRVIYKGKWHIDSEFISPAEKISRSESPSGPNQQVIESEAKAMRDLWGFDDWNGPDAGVSVTPNQDGFRTLGGGSASNDRRYALGPNILSNQQSALDFLKAEHENPGSDPFCLIVSLVNPHDIWAADYLTENTELFPAIFQYYQDFKLPESYWKDDLTTKPWAQSNLINSYGGIKKTLTKIQEQAEQYLESVDSNVSAGTLPQNDALNYVKFYAYLHTLNDKHFDELMDAMEEMQPAFLDNTILIRLADHGEMGMAHSGLTEKICNVYSETVNIPLIFHSPKLFPEPVESPYMVGLVDILPTLAKIAQVPDFESYNFQGIDISQTLLRPEHPTQEGLLFTYDDASWGLTNYLPPPNATYIRAIVTEEWKYAVYFDLDQDTNTLLTQPVAPQYELYDLKNDPNEITNLTPVGGVTLPEHKELQLRLHRLLTAKMEEIDSRQPITSLDETKTTKPNDWEKAYPEKKHLHPEKLW